MADIGKITPGSRIPPYAPHEHPPEKKPGDRDDDEQKDGNDREPGGQKPDEHDGNGDEDGIDVYV